MKVSFSLTKKSATSSNLQNVGGTTTLRRPLVFASIDDDEPIDAAQTASSSSNTRNVASNKALAAQAAAGMSKSLKKRMEAEQNVDETVFEYDEVWDRMQEAKAREKEKKEVESQVRKPKYISSLLQSASVRKLDHLRAEEKMIQREREMEGDEFADKDAFVTQAYKDQMEEVRRAEEEEKRREQEEEKKRGPSTGMTHFYRQLLEQSEKQHNETIAATLPAAERKAIIGPASGPNLTITKPPEKDSDTSPVHAPVSDLERALAARAEGKDVELNDDNQIVDKRELLSAGLNLSAPNTRRLGGSRTGKKPGQQSEDNNEGEAVAHRAVGIAASRKEINERRQRAVLQQLDDEQERIAKAKEEAEAARIRRIVTKRNTEDDVKSARERYQERKRRRMEESSTVESSVKSSSPVG